MSQRASDVCFEITNANPEDSLEHLFPFGAHKIGWLFSGICMLISTALSFHLILMHSKNYTRPSQQRYIIRILILVPIYSVTTWASYIFYRHSPYFEFVRGIYEGFVVASFFLLLINYLGERREEQRKALQKRQKGQPFHLLPPFCCIAIPANSRHFLNFLKYGILQYVIFKPILSLISMVLFYYGYYCPGDMHLDNGRLYLVILNALALLLALYTLTNFYWVMHESLRPHQPALKFLSVKLVVFFLLFQLWVISIFENFHLIKATKYWTVNNISTGVNAILLNFEMIFVSLLHYYAFPYQDYQLKPNSSTLCYSGIKDAINPVDILWEISYSLKYFWHVLIHDNHSWEIEHPEKKALRSSGKEEIADIEREVESGSGGRRVFTSATAANLVNLYDTESSQSQDSSILFQEEVQKEGEKVQHPEFVHEKQ